MAIAETISGIKLVTEGLKGILDIAKTIKNADLLEKTSTLLGNLIEVQVTVIDLQGENETLKSKIEKLKHDLEFSENLHFENNVYWSRDESDNLVQAYCPKCWDDEKKAMKMQKEYDKTWPGTGWQCPKCNTKARFVETKKS